MLTVEEHQNKVKLYTNWSVGEVDATPLPIVREMSLKFDESILIDKDSKFLDPTCGTGTFLIDLYWKLREYHGHDHIVSNMIYGNDISFISNKMLKQMGFKNITNGDFAKLDSKLDKIKDMRFDGIVLNPPYKYGSHMDHINNAFGLLKDKGKMVAIHPATPFINRKPTSENGNVIRIKEIVSDYKSELKLVDGNSIFNAGFFVPLSITTVTKETEAGINVIYSHYSPSDEVKKYESLDDVFMHGNDIVLSIRDKIFSKMDNSVEDFNIRCGKRGNFYLKVTSIVGHPPKNGKVNADFYCILYKDDENNFEKVLTTKVENNNLNYISFRTEDQARNGFEYLKTKFARFSLSLTKLNQTTHRGELKSVPYMDFTQEWTDAKLKEHFKITDTEWEFIDEYIGDWYEADCTK